MSWFSDLTSRAEAMLVKLDREAAQALQQPDNILSSAIDKIVPNSDDGHNEVVEIESSTPITHIPETQDETSSNTLPLYSENNLVKQTVTNNLHVNNEPDNFSPPSVTLESQPISRDTRESSDSSRYIEPDATLLKADHSQQQISTKPEPELGKPTTSKFTYQASKTKSRQKFLQNKQTPDRLNRSTALNHDRSSDNLISADSPQLNYPGANDIRASINKSLRDYVEQSSPLPSRSSTSSYPQTSYTTYFDNQPTLVERQTYSRNDDTVGRNGYSSLSIDVPDQRASDKFSNGIAGSFLKQTALKKKSTFYLHKVINRLANNQGAQYSPLLSDDMRIRFRRVQMRGASYARRLNYYFRNYPMMKYLMITYLVLIQILVVYVLFFYQSSSSPTDLSSQIKLQQQEFASFNTG